MNSQKDFSRALVALVFASISLFLNSAEKAWAKESVREISRKWFTLNLPDTVILRELSDHVIDIRSAVSTTPVRIIIAEKDKVKFPSESGDYSMTKEEFRTPAIKQDTYWKDGKLRGKELVIKVDATENTWIHVWVPITDADAASRADKIVSSMRVR